MLNCQFPPWPSFTDEEVCAVGRVLASNKVNYWTGDECREFEREFAAYTDCTHAIALANGTVALDVALKALEVGPGDDVIVTPRTFIASISSVVTAGARPVFADVDSDTQAISAETIAKVLTPSTTAVIVVHLGGMPADLDPIMALAKEHGFKVIEDCAQAHGARYKGRSVGSIGDVGAWSFCQDKIMTTGGEGGMVTTNDEALWSVMWSFKDHGKSYDAVYNREHAPGFRWLHDSFGTNWRMLEMQGVIGRIQTSRMPQWHEKRLKNAKQIWQTCREFNWLRVPEIPNDVEHAAYKCYVFVEPERLPEGWSRDRIVQEVSDLGVPCFQGTCSEVYLERAFDNSELRPEQRLPIAKKLGETSLMFLVHPTLEQEHIDLTCSALIKVHQKIRNSLGLKATAVAASACSSEK